MGDTATTSHERSWQTAGRVRGGVKPASASHAHSWNLPFERAAPSRSFFAGVTNHFNPLNAATRLAADSWG